MVILEIDVDGVLAVEGECEAKVAGNSHRPTSFLCAAKGMEHPSGNIHVPRPGRRIEPVQHPLDARPMLGGNTPRRTGGEKPLEAFVPEAAYHGLATEG